MIAMDAGGIYDRLRQAFPDSVGDLVSDNPDPYIVVDAASIAQITEFLKSTDGLEFDFLESVSGVDDGEQLWLVYHLLSLKHRHSLTVKLSKPYDELDVPSVSSVWTAANWHEREQFDLFGFNFVGHPDLRRIMLPDDWVGYPLRKDYQPPADYHGISHHREDPKQQLKALDEVRLKAAEKAAASSSGAAAPGEEG